MMDRLTKRKHEFAELKTTELNDTCEFCFEAIQKLAHYEDLAEAGRLMILPKDYDMKKLKEEHCPFFLVSEECEKRCYDYADCDECWEAALKERESE